ncbi:hypothetical protein [Weissella minor]|nr:hypothetical protein [Weissella minor]
MMGLNLEKSGFVKDVREYLKEDIELKKKMEKHLENISKQLEDK